MSPSKSFLIIQTAFIGDVILAMPIVEKLHQYYPDADIDFLVRKGNESLLEEHPKLREVLVWNKKQQKYKNLLGLKSKIRSQNYDAIINAQRFAASGFLTAFSGANEKIGFDKNPFSFFYHKKIKHKIGEDTHEVSRNLQLIEHLTDGDFVRPALYPSNDDVERIKPYQSGDYICIAPSSVWFTKQFPAEKWVQFTEALPYDLNILLIGSPADSCTCEMIKTTSHHPNVYNLAGKLSLLQSAALIQDARLTYTNDSAPMHLASAMNAPVAAVFCSTTPKFGFGPLSEVSHIIQTEQNLPCRPCGLHGKKKCPKGHFKCANTIDVEKMAGIMIND